MITKKLTFLLLLLGLLLSCSKKDRNSKRNYSNTEEQTKTLVKSERIKQIPPFVYIDTLFEQIKVDTLPIHSNDSIYYDPQFGGRKIDSLIAYYYLGHFLTFKSSTNSDFFATYRFQIDSIYNIYIFRIPSSYDSKLVSIFVYNKKNNLFTQQLKAADWVGDEGIVIERQSILDIKNLTVVTTISERKVKKEKKEIFKWDKDSFFLFKTY